MGYTTNFRGHFTVTPALTPEQTRTLVEFKQKRHEPSPLPGRPHGSYYCQWEPSEDGTALQWDGGEKFYCYIGWLRYLIDTFIVPWGCTLSGKVAWQGEEVGDVGVISVTNNVVEATAYEP